MAYAAISSTKASPTISFIFSIMEFYIVLFFWLILVLATDPTILAYLVTDIRSFIGVGWIFALIITIASLFISTATIIESAVRQDGKNLSAKELFVSTTRLLKRPFYTWFYTTLLGMGYSFFFLANLLPTVLIFQHPFAWIALCIILVILASVLYTYLVVVWTLAIVVSVLEETSGIDQALGKAAQLVKGQKVYGLLLTLLFTVLFFLPIRDLCFLEATPLQISYSVFRNIILLQYLVVWMCCCYYQRKKTYGEKVELQVGFEHSKISSTLLLDENIP